MSVTFGCREAPKEKLPCRWCGEGGEWLDRPEDLTPEGRCDRWCKGFVMESTAPEVNWSSSNAGPIIRLLGLPSDEEGPWGELKVEEIPGVLQRIMVVLAKSREREHMIEEPSETRGARGARVIEFGNTDVSTVNRLRALRTLLSWAHERGFGVNWG